MQEEKKRKTHVSVDHIEDFYPNIAVTASAQECTGLIGTNPQDSAAEDNYKDLSSTETPKKNT